MSTIHLFGVVFYGIWGSGEVQPWAKTNENEVLRETSSFISNICIIHIKHT